MATCSTRLAAKEGFVQRTCSVGDAGFTGLGRQCCEHRLEAPAVYASCTGRFFSGRRQRVVSHRAFVFDTLAAFANGPTGSRSGSRLLARQLIVASGLGSTRRGSTLEASQEEEDSQQNGSDWRELTPENAVALTLTAVAAFALGYILWQMLVVVAVIVVAALKYAVVAALLVAALLFLL